MELGHVVQADGRWRLFFFADNRRPDNEHSMLLKLCDLLESADSPLRRYSSVNEDIDSVFDVRAVFQHTDIEITDVPNLLFPAKGRYGLRDYEKCFCIDHEPGRNIFELRGIDTDQGCMVIVRPDQHIANVLPLNNYNEMAKFFSAFMVPVDANS